MRDEVEVQTSHHSIIPILLRFDKMFAPNDPIIFLYETLRFGTPPYNRNLEKNYLEAWDMIIKNHLDIIRNLKILQKSLTTVKIIRHHKKSL